MHWSSIALHVVNDYLQSVFLQNDIVIYQPDNKDNLIPYYVVYYEVVKIYIGRTIRPRFVSLGKTINGW